MSENREQDAFLAVSGLTVSRGDRRVLDGLELSIRKGEIFGLLGPNGAGKSTAFQALAGLLPAEAGDVTLEGETMPLGDRRLRARLGVVFQSPALDDRLSARQNLSLAGALYGLSGADLKKRVAKGVVLAELEGRDREPVKQLSGGMRRRLELARALIHDPALLLMDEPTSGLDQASYEGFWRLLKRLTAEGSVTVLMTTHRAEEAELCDRLAFLSGGKVLALDSPAALKDRVGGDVLELVVEDPEETARILRETLSLEPEVRARAVRIVSEKGHELVPRVVEALPRGSLESVSVHRPGLGDVFLTLAGRDLTEDETP